jgi:hypothetical protein
MPSDPLFSAYAEATEATPTDLTRLRAQLRAQRAPARRWTGLLVPTMAVAAAAVVSVTLVEWSPQPVTASFTDARNQAVQAAPGVQLTVNGTGELSGTEQAPVLAWNAGTVAVSVEPGAGLDVRVQTDEALVRVVGTVFSVDRGPLGTTVDVTRGQVAVTCTKAPEQQVTADQSVTCWPTTAPGLLGRAQALRDQGSASSGILATVERGLGLTPSSAIHTELSALRVVLLSEGPNLAAAVDAAATHLARPDAGRRAEIARMGAALGYQIAGCEGVQGFIADLPPEEVAASALSMCQTDGGDGDPG